MALLIPGSSGPSNLHLTPAQASIPMEGSVYEFARRLAEEVEGGESLFIVIHSDHPKPFVIMERVTEGPDQGDRFVLRTDQLDQRLITKLQRIVKVPLRERMAEALRVNEAYEKAYREEELDELYENFGRPMWTQLEKDGFIDGRSVSYPKKGIAQAKRMKAGSVVLPAGVKP